MQSKLNSAEVVVVMAEKKTQSLAQTGVRRSQVED